MNLWEEVRADWHETTIEYPDLVTARCPFCHRYHTTIYFYGVPMDDQIFCPRCGKKVVYDEAKLEKKEARVNVRITNKHF